MIRRNPARADILATAGLAPLQLGFGGPFDLMTGPRLGSLVAAQPGIAKIADPAKMRLLFSHIRHGRQGFACRKLLFYALWHRRHILGLPPAGDVFETLAAT